MFGIAWKFCELLCGVGDCWQLFAVRYPGKVLGIVGKYSNCRNSCEVLGNVWNCWEVLGALWKCWGLLVTIRKWWDCWELLGSGYCLELLQTARNGGELLPSVGIPGDSGGMSRVVAKC